MGVTGMAKSHFCQLFYHKMAKLIQSRNFKTQQNQKSAMGIFAWAPETRFTR
jgi:hypothetical protein